MKLVGESFDLIESETFMKNRASNPLSRKSILHNKKEKQQNDFFYTYVILKHSWKPEPSHC